MFDFLLKTLYKNSIYLRYSREVDQGDGGRTNPRLAQQNPTILCVNKKSTLFMVSNGYFHFVKMSQI